MIDVNQEQRRASNPKSSVWVSASAGSGKTKVLTDRVLNLLLMSAHPEKILCLTFTKTAAAEMANRINDVLKSWVVMPNSKLADEISKLTDETVSLELIDKARKLFAMTLETPGGMKIMTIHSFSQSILKRFPLEAGVSPHFEVMDDTTSEDILSALMKEAFQNPSLSTSLEILSRYLDEVTLSKLLKNVLAQRYKIIQLLEKNSLNNIIHELKRYFNIQNYYTEKQIIEECCSEMDWPKKCAEFLLKTKKGIKKKYETDDEAKRIFDANLRLNAFKTVHATHALLDLTFYIITLYERRKKSMAVLDYEDLIEYTRKLLDESQKAAWVLYKLDGGIDHILVDEAQDTNPNQWCIIKMLADEFFAGMGANDNIRTLFAVGDKKQSIYSFQGAQPDEFERMRQFFEKRVIDSQNTFATVPFNFSFRSTEPILRLVNFVLRYPPARKGVLPIEEDGTHLAFREFDAGHVEIWPIEKPQEQDTPEAWKPPIERTPIQSPVTRLAEKIAIKIKKMIDDKEILPSQGRPIKAGDFLILVQRRKKFVSELVRFLKEYRIPVAGIDRLILTDYIAVQDLISLAKFALLPEDDLNLAEILKSPLIRLSEEDLFKICYNRENESVFQRIQKLYPETASFLLEIMDLADKMPPFEFFSHILSVKKGRQHFVARLGNEVNEALDEFLNLTLTYEKTNVASLQSFLRWISKKDIEIKRDLDQSSLDAVRIMTVHGSKGLQGNIVFLPDTRFIPAQKPPVVWTNNDLPIWTPISALKTPEAISLYNNFEDEQLCEYHRLLYVAITRPKDRLYICGWDNKREAKPGNWYDLIVDSLPYTPDHDGIIRFSCEQKREIFPQKKAVNIQSCKNVLPSWAITFPPNEPIPAKPLRPSVHPETEPVEESLKIQSQSHSLKRGIFIHKLLQYLPQVDLDRRYEVAKKMKPDNIDIPENLFTLLEDKRFQVLFGKNSAAEVPVIGVVDNQVISGQIDRMVISENEVLIVDFKSNYNVPKTVENVQSGYKKQLNMYKALLKNIFPDKIIKTYLLWTQNLTLMEIE